MSFSNILENAIQVTKDQFLKRMVFLLSHLFPRNQKIWVFGSWNGERFAGNSKYLFLEASRDKYPVQPIWLSKNQNIVKKLRGRGFESYHTSSIEGIYYNLRAGKILLTHGIMDVNYWCSGSAQWIQLWHGLPLKKIKWSTEDFQKNWKNKIRSLLYERYDKILTTSEFWTEIFSEAFNLEKSRIEPLGYPRNDILRKNNFKMNETIGKSLQKENLIGYFPTYRGHNEKKNPIDWKNFNNFLEEENLFLITKAHPNAQEELEGLEQIQVVPAEADIQPILNNIELLITDYSSVFFDFLLVDKPIIFFPYDLEKYRENRGFYFDYEDFVPGPIIESSDLLKKTITKEIDKDTFRDKRSKLKRKALAGDGKASKNILEHLSDDL